MTATLLIWVLIATGALVVAIVIGLEIVGARRAGERARGAQLARTLHDTLEERLRHFQPHLPPGERTGPRTDLRLENWGQW